MEHLVRLGSDLFGPFWVVIWTLIKIIVIVAPLMGAVAYMTLAERKVIGWMQIRIGPDRTTIFGISWLRGLAQPIADGMKMMFKEVIIPTKVSRALYFLGPLLAIAPALAAWAVVPFYDGYVLANVNAGLLLFMAITGIGVYGVIVSGWASNSKYALLGAMRSAAQMISYELAMSFALIGVLMVSGSLNISEIVLGQGRGWFAGHGISLFSWNWLPLLPLFFVYFAAGVAETNRAPFDVVEGESEIVAGHMIEYSGMTFALFFLAEYANMILVSTMTALFFLGGWLSPFTGVGGWLAGVPVIGTVWSVFWGNGVWWLFAKAAFLLFVFLWIRATFPRFRYDQIMRLGWKVFVPICLVWVLVLGIWILSPLSVWK